MERSESAGAVADTFHGNPAEVGRALAALKLPLAFSIFNTCKPEAFLANRKLQRKSVDRNLRFHCGSQLSFDISSFRPVQTMIFAVEEINQSKAPLPNITLGYEIYDDCSTTAIASKAALALVKGEPGLILYPMCEGFSNVAAIIGCDIPTSSIAAISYFSTCSCLSDKQEYPTFFRTIPNDKHQTDPAEKISKMVHAMKEATTKVVVGFLDSGDMRVLVKEILRQNVTGIQWIGNSTDCVKCPSEYWSNQQKDRCIPKKIEFLSFQEALGYVFVTLALVGACLALATASVFYRYRETL
ncbi:hypothetical protein chiPu_0010733 [Chiloscyllium punctatum]|uniref:Receptor ligand binding region domain-containing protein n=1 Tax=Chiloscyllium punctatum TaxID=137246 RepID=A0A401SPF6_CHIPU|nr:hypothetical protein [Chiloscyllium punctatum]